MNIENLTIENAHLFLQDWEAQHIHVEHDLSKCEECEGNMIISNFFWTCSGCGLTDLDRPEGVALEGDAYIPKKSMYKRKLYCMEKLKLMNCHKLSGSINYKRMIKDLRDYEDKFDTVFELKVLMKKLKYNKFYKFIYVAYFDIKGVKLINLKWNDMNKISDTFVKLEWKFRDTIDTHHRKNMLSYSTMIYVIMKRFGYKSYEHILLPQNHKQVEESIKLL